MFNQRRTFFGLAISLILGLVFVFPAHASSSFLSTVNNFFINGFNRLSENVNFFFDGALRNLERGLENGVQTAVKYFNDEKPKPTIIVAKPVPAEYQAEGNRVAGLQGNSELQQSLNGKPHTPNPAEKVIKPLAKKETPELQPKAGLPPAEKPLLSEVRLPDFITAGSVDQINSFVKSVQDYLAAARSVIGEVPPPAPKIVNPIPSVAVDRTSEVQNTSGEPAESISGVSRSLLARIQQNLKHLSQSMSDLFIVDSKYEKEENLPKEKKETAALVEQIDSTLRSIGNSITNLFKKEEPPASSVIVAVPVSKTAINRVSGKPTPAQVIQPTAPTPQPTAINQIGRQSVIQEIRTEKVIVDNSSINSFLSDFEAYKKSQQKLIAEMAQVSNVGPRGNVSYTISNPTFTGTAQGLDDGDIPDDITVQNYLPLTGGTITGNLTVNGTLAGLGGSSLSLADKLKVGTDTLIIDGINNYLSTTGGTLSLYSTSTPIQISFLNATSTYSSYFTGNLGIGTTSPGAALSVGSGTTTLLSGETYILGTTTVYALHATSTLSVASSSPTSPFAVVGRSVFGGDVNITGNIKADGNLKVGGVVIDQTGQISGIGSLSVNIGISSTTPGAALAVKGAGLFDGFVSANYFTSTSSLTSWLLGSLGIGTTTPGAKLAVEGFGVVKGNFNIEATSTVGSLIATSTLSVGTSTPATNNQLAVQGNAYISQGLGVGAATTSPGGLFVKGSADIYDGLIVRGGKVGIGTQPPLSPFQISGSMVPTDAGVSGGALQLGNRGTVYSWIQSNNAHLALNPNFNSVGIGRSALTTGFKFEVGASSGGTDDAARFQGDIDIIGVGINGVGGSSADINIGNGITATSTISGQYGNLGFGSTTPLGQISIEAVQEVVGSNTPIFVIGDSGSSTPFIYVSGNNGFVGIATNSPSAALAVGANASGDAIFGNNVSIINNLDVQGTAQIDTLAVGSLSLNTGIGTTTPGAALGVKGAGLFEGDLTVSFLRATSTTATSTFDGGVRLARLGGNVGIGTSTPSHQLSVGEGLLVGGTATSTFEGNVHVWKDLVIGKGTTFLTADTLKSSGAFTITGDSVQSSLTLQSFGRVGVSSSTPWGVLSAEHNGADEDRPVFVLGDQGTSSPYIYVEGGYGRVGFGTTSPFGQVSIEITGDPNNPNNEGLPAFVVSSRGTSTPAFYIANSNGNVGVGTSSPSALFAVGGATILGGDLTVTGTVDLQGSCPACTQWTTTGNDIYYTTGNVGVGTTTPNLKLEVAGFGVVKGNWNVEATSTVSSLIATSTLSVGSSSPDGAQFAVVGRSIFGGDVAITGAVDIQGTCTGCGGNPGGSDTQIQFNNSSAFGGSSGLTFASNNLTLTGDLFVNGSDLNLGNGITATSTFSGEYGKLGLATTSPYAQFAIEAVAGVATSTNPVFVIGDSGTSSPMFIVDGGYGRVGFGTSSPYGQVSIEVSGEPSNNNNENIPAFVIGSRGTSTPIFVVNSSNGYSGFGTTTPWGRLSVEILDQGDETVPSFVVGDTGTSTPALAVYSSGITVIDQLQTGALSFDTNAGAISWIDLPVTGNASGGSGAGWGTVESYSAQTDATSTLTVYAESDGKGGVFRERVGIGTTTPGGTLAIHSGTSSQPALLLYQGEDSGEAIRVQTGDNKAALLLNGLGNLGIGTTTPGARLAVEGFGVVKGNWNVGATSTVGSLIATSTLSVGTSTPGTNTQLSVGGNAYISGGLGIGAATTSAGGLFVKGSADIYDGLIVRGGKVGIATTSPTVKLAVVGSGVGDGLEIREDGVSGATNLYLTNGSGNAASRNWLFSTNYDANGALSIRSGNSNTQNPYSDSQATTRLLINSSGQVGIGSTTPYGQFSVEAIAGTVNANTPIFVIGDQGTATPFLLVSGNNGFIGISSSSPSEKLVIGTDLNGSTDRKALAFGNGGWGGPVAAGANSDGDKIILYNSSTQKVGIGFDSSNSIWLQSSSGGFRFFTDPGDGATAPTEKVTITNGGNLGIGTTTPRGMLGIGVASSTPGILIQTTGNSGDGTIAIMVDSNAVCDDNGAVAACALNDLAESFRTSEVMEAGDLAVFDPENPIRLKKATQDKRNLLAGAISTSPAIVFEGSGLKALGGVYTPEEDKMPLALSGRVPVKVNLEGGEIKIGDPITISSVAGVGKKATESGQIVGYALQNLTSANTTPGGIDKILMLADRGYWVNEQAESSSEPSWLAQVIDKISNWLKDTVVTIKELVTEKITTKQLCVGETCVNEDQLKALLSNSNQANESNQPSDQGTNQLSNQATDSEPPTITLNGLNPTEIEVGSTYSDLGATVTDNVTQNLGYKVSLDGGLEIYPNELTLDTSTAGEHTITYIAVDQAENRGTATRQITVYDPNAPAVPPPDPEQPPVEPPPEPPPPN